VAIRERRELLLHKQLTDCAVKYIGPYLRELVQPLWARVFYLLDALSIFALIVGALDPALRLPMWTVWFVPALLVVALLSANYTIYSNLSSKLEPFTSSRVHLGFETLEDVESERFHLRLAVRNEETSREVELSANVESLWWYPDPGGSRGIEKDLNYPKFSWHQAPRDATQVIPPRDRAILDIAYWDGAPVFIFDSGPRRYQIGQYTVTIKFIGKVGERYIEPVLFNGIIDAYTGLQQGFIGLRFHLTKLDSQR
jgi:hypothetical protein